MPWKHYNLTLSLRKHVKKKDRKAKPGMLAQVCNGKYLGGRIRWMPNAVSSANLAYLVLGQ